MKEPGLGHRTFHLHKSVLEHHSSSFKWFFEQNPNDAHLYVQAPISTFRDLASWLYGSKFSDITTAEQGRRLWHLATRYDMSALRNALVDWCRNHCRDERRLVRLLREFAASTSIPDEKMSDYILEKLAHNITSKGWVRSIEASDGEWERFMSTRDTASIKKGKYVSALMLKLEEAEKLNTENKLTDPATAICK